MAICQENKISQIPENEVSFLIDKRLYFDSFKYDFYRKCLLPSKENDYFDIIIVGRSEAYEKKKNSEGKVIKCKCGSYAGSYVCDCRSTRKSKMNYCYRVSCKVCFHKGITRQANRIFERLEKIEKLEGQLFQLAHFTFNVENDTLKIQVSGYNIIDIESLVKYKAKLLRILTKYGFDGILIFHPYRKDWDRMKKLKDGKFYVKKSPHFHAIGRFVNLPNGDVFYKKYKFTYKNISYDQYKKGKQPTPYLQNMDHIRNEIRYLLSHTASLTERMKHYSYCGSFSTVNYRKINEIKKMVPVYCEVCEGVLCLCELKKYVKELELRALVKAYKLRYNVNGVPFNTAYDYSEPLLLNREKIFKKLLWIYDLVHKDDLEVLSVKSCFSCINVGIDYQGCPCDRCKSQCNWVCNENAICCNCIYEEIKDFDDAKCKQCVDNSKFNPKRN